MNCGNTDIQRSLTILIVSPSTCLFVCLLLLLLLFRFSSRPVTFSSYYCFKTKADGVGSSGVRLLSRIFVL